MYLQLKNRVESITKWKKTGDSVFPEERDASCIYIYIYLRRLLVGGWKNCSDGRCQILKLHLGYYHGWLTMTQKYWWLILLEMRMCRHWRNWKIFQQRAVIHFNSLRDLPRRHHILQSAHQIGVHCADHGAAAVDLLEKLFGTVKRLQVRWTELRGIAECRQSRKCGVRKIIGPRASKRVAEERPAHRWCRSERQRPGVEAWCFSAIHVQQRRGSCDCHPHKSFSDVTKNRETFTQTWKCSSTSGRSTKE